MSELEIENKIIDAAKAKFGATLTDSKIERPRRVYLTFKKESILDAVSFLKNEFSGTHVSTITGLEAEESYEVLYHIATRPKGLGEVEVEVTVRALVPKDDPTISSITPVLPGAVLYEREVHDLVGINFEGHPGLSRLVLPDDWPDDLYPLRKERDVHEVKKAYEESRK
ncbi:MAG: NADH-quinone oxidoreductase subunit C [Candidatus Sifarchaeia archaeon]